MRRGEQPGVDIRTSMPGTNITRLWKYPGWRASTGFKPAVFLGFLVHPKTPFRPSPVHCVPRGSARKCRHLMTLSGAPRAKRSAEARAYQDERGGSHEKAYFRNDKSLASADLFALGAPESVMRCRHFR